MLSEPPMLLVYMLQGNVLQLYVLRRLLLYRHLLRRRDLLRVGRQLLWEPSMLSAGHPLLRRAGLL